MRAAILASSALLLAAAWVVSRQVQAAEVSQAEVAPGVALPDFLGTAESLLTGIDTALVDQIAGIVPVGWGFDMWSEAKVPEQYRNAIRAAEVSHGLPYNMLARLLWQECRYRPEIISGAVSSPAGAQGIAQFMPATAAELGINPLDPFQAIPAAARYLRRLYDALGEWSLALAAYNWGIGNVQRKGIAAAPLETRNYYSQIMADIGLGVTIV